MEDFSVFTGFSCLRPEDKDRDLDEFIRHDAERHFKDKVAVTYQLESVVDPELAGIPLGFATLQNDAIRINGDDSLPDICVQYPYRAFPAVKIGRFGIHVDYQRNNLGSLFLFMLKWLLTTENRTGCRYITVDARRDKKNKIDVTGFYRRNQFEELPWESKTSKYVPMYFDLINFEP
ncbi:hypothetical protein [Megalodesulfovibrio gigas]|uniref:hypothetical protein n=1 Tax=Megalodesulfovibrio gigas TaxID=879 RepID=UPI000417BC00|nr:hypothetical protein [Megalodesulfovibrio gigas]